MREKTYKLITTSPLLLHGAGGARDAPEVRTPSLRGVLRYWLRAGLRGQNLNDNGVRTIEAAIFGTAGDRNATASAVRCLLEADAANRADRGRFQVLPHAAGQRGQVCFSGIRDGVSLSLRLIKRPTGATQVPVFEIADELIPLALGLGGLGLRSRRGFGTVAIQPPIPIEKAIASFRKAIASLRNELPRAMQGTSNASIGVPRLAPDQCVVLEGIMHGGAVTERDPFLGALRKVMIAFHDAAAIGSGGRTFGQVQGGRIASAIHVRLLADRREPCVRATIFKVEADERTAKRLGKWCRDLDLKPVWGEKWF